MTSVIRAQLQSLLLFWGYDHLLFVLTFSEMARLCLSLLFAKSWGSWKARVTAFPMAFRSVLGAVPSWSHIEEGLLGFVTSLPAPPATLRSPPPSAEFADLSCHGPVSSSHFARKRGSCSHRKTFSFSLPSSYPSLDLSGLWRHVCSFQLP